MRKIYIIGTSHQKIDAKLRLEFYDLFLKINPDQIFIEKLSTEVATKNFRNDRPEMALAYQWAIDNNKIATAFDYKLNFIKRSVSKIELDNINIELTKITQEIGWKELNEFKNIQLLEVALGRVIDRGKYNKRETRMLDKINKNILKEGNILVLCGTLHVPFLKKNMKEAFLLADIR